MTKKNAKKKFGFEGTKRLRKMWQLAIQRGKTPNMYPRTPNFNPMRKKLTKAERLLKSYLISADRVLLTQ